MQQPHEGIAALSEANRAMTAVAASAASSHAIPRPDVGGCAAGRTASMRWSFQRLVFAVIIGSFCLPAAIWRHPGRAGLCWALYCPGAGAAWHIVLRPVFFHAAAFALLLDCGFLSWQLHLGGERAACFFPLYLWVIFGNGFRFGIPFLSSPSGATMSFGAVVATTPTGPGSPISPRIVDRADHLPLMRER